jgi:hypothetical protein
VNTFAAPRPFLQRWLALLVRYWAFNMTLGYRRGMRWPGFGYSEAEQAQLSSIAAGCAATEYYAWVGGCVVFFLIIAALIVMFGMQGLVLAIGGEQHMADTPAVLFFFAMALQLVVCFMLGFPAAMLAAAALTGRWFNVAEAALPDRPVVAHLFHRLWLQISRVALLGIVAVLLLWLFVPADSKAAAVAGLVMPLLSPAVAVLTAVYYFSARLVRSAPP